MGPPPLHPAGRPKPEQSAVFVMAEWTQRKCLDTRRLRRAIQDELGVEEGRDGTQWSQFAQDNNIKSGASPLPVAWFCVNTTCWIAIEVHNDQEVVLYLGLTRQTGEHMKAKPVAMQTNTRLVGLLRRYGWWAKAVRAEVFVASEPHGVVSTSSPSFSSLLQGDASLRILYGLLVPVGVGMFTALHANQEMALAPAIGLAAAVVVTTWLALVGLDWWSKVRTREWKLDGWTRGAA